MTNLHWKIISTQFIYTALYTYLNVNSLRLKDLLQKCPVTLYKEVSERREERLFLL